MKLIALKTGSTNTNKGPQIVVFSQIVTCTQKKDTLNAGLGSRSRRVGAFLGLQESESESAKIGRLRLLKPQKCNKIVIKFSMQMLIQMYNVNLSF